MLVNLEVFFMRVQQWNGQVQRWLAGGDGRARSYRLLVQFAVWSRVTSLLAS